MDREARGCSILPLTGGRNITHARTLSTSLKAGKICKRGNGVPIFHPVTPPIDERAWASSGRSPRSPGSKKEQGHPPRAVLGRDGRGHSLGQLEAMIARLNSIALGYYGGLGNILASTEGWGFSTSGWGPPPTSARWRSRSTRRWPGSHCSAAAVFRGAGPRVGGSQHAVWAGGVQPRVGDRPADERDPVRVPRPAQLIGAAVDVADAHADDFLGLSGSTGLRVVHRWSLGAAAHRGDGVPADGADAAAGKIYRHTDSKISEAVEGWRRYPCR